MNERPHRFPQRVLEAERDGAEILGWECAACGAWIREFGKYEPGECSVDWRAES